MDAKERERDEKDVKVDKVKKYMYREREGLEE